MKNGNRMNIESIRDYCLTLPLATEDFPFGEDFLVIRVLGKIFACIDLTHPERVTLKCDPDRAIDLRSQHPEIEGAWHWNKKYWNQVNLYGTLDDDFIRAQIRHSYIQVVKKLTKKDKAAHAEVLAVEE